jgi:hypothetical protein
MKSLRNTWGAVRIMDEYRIMQDSLNTMRYALTIKRLSEELYEHLCDSILYLIRYSEKNNMVLPNRSSLLDLVEKSRMRIDIIKNTQLPYHILDKGTSSDEHIQATKNQASDEEEYRT